jgi:FkbM family methyltransferase
MLPHAGTDYIQRKLAAEKVPYEFEMLNEMQARLSPGDLVIDIGANVGNHTLYLAAVAGCKVVAFEPNGELADAMQASVRLNNLQEQVAVHALALGNTAQRGRFEKAIPDNLGAQSITVAEDGPLSIEELDNIELAASVKAIKIDVEGMELAVLQGAEKRIAADRPLLYVECIDQASFRAIDQWMVAHGYAYWDTFNATPTHLYLPNERSTLDQRMSRLQSRVAQESYRTGQEIGNVRGMLDNANLKYRTTIEQISTLKSKLAQEETARQLAEQRAVAAQGQVTQYEARLAAERGSLEKELARLQALSLEQKQALQDAEQEMARLEASLKEQHLGSSEWQRKNERANELVATLRQQLQESEARLAADTVGHQQAERQLLLLDAALTASRNGAADWQQQHQQAQQQLGALEAERQSLRQEVARLAAQGQEHSTQMQQAERQIVLLDAALNASRAIAEDLQQKYLAVNAQLATLQQQLVVESQASAAAVERSRADQELLTQARMDLLDQRATLQEEISRLLAEAQASAAQSVATAGALQQLQDEHSKACASLDQANVKYRQVNIKYEELKQRLAIEEHAAREAEALWSETQGALDDLRARFNELGANHRATTEQLGSLSAAHEATSAELALAGVRLAEQTQRIERQTAARDEVEQKWQLAQRQVAEANNALHQANQKYRHAHSTEIPQLKQKLEAGQSAARQQQHELSRLKQELAAASKALAAAHQQAQALQAKKIAAEQQVLRTRASLSFQLGYILIHGFKSLRGFINMPRALLNWRQDVLKRRKLAAQRQQNLATVAAQRPVAVASKPVSAATSAIAQPAVQAPPATAPALTAVAPAAAAAQRLKVACIMDEFTFESYRPECELQQLTPTEWQKELTDFQPELLFIESAWRGKDELWGSKVGHGSQEVQGIIAWCRSHGVPTIFWNKEDPVHFETFLSTAKLFDYVFTTDIDCIHRYKAALKHERVFLLPFACQPANNNPIEKYQRKDAFCFAGAYYVRYPERTRDLGNFVSALPTFRPLEIYDRNFGKNDVNYQFPPEYQPYIVGTLPFDQIDKAYKGYRYAVNLNSIKQSQSMFARRVFELLASNTITVSNFSRGIRLLFGDLVITTDSGDEMVRGLQRLAGDELRGDKLRLAALRKVVHEHSYAQRLSYIVSKVRGQAEADGLPVIACVAAANNNTELNNLLQMFGAQTLPNSRMTVVIGAGVSVAGIELPAGVQLRTREDSAGATLAAVTGEADMIAGLLAKDYYGPNYLLDIALATRYSNAKAIGKGAAYAWRNGEFQLLHADLAYRNGALDARSAAVRAPQVADEAALAWLDALPEAKYVDEGSLAIDRFNYCQDGAGAPGVARAELVDDIRDLNIGISVHELLARAEAIPPEEQGEAPAGMLDGRTLSGLFKRPPSAAVQMEVDGNDWRVHSTLADGKHEYLYATADLTLEELGWSDKAEFYFDATPGLNLQLVLVFLDAQKQKISHVIKHSKRNQDAEIPLGTAAIRFGLRVYAGGNADIKGLVLGHRDLQPSEIIGTADRLILTNHYPSYEDLYRNGFVHSRVMAYRERGIRTDVFRMRPNEPVSYHEFEDVDVTTGSQEVLNQMLTSGRYKTVMVHFLEPSMWEVLQHHIDRVKVIVWVHGAEIQPWHRRDYNYTNEEERTVAKMKSDARMSFWRGLLQSMPANLQLVFVSRYFAEEVMEDLGFRIPEQHYTIIHNPIDTDVFSYQRKPAEQRKKVLSIRPYASAKYANDLSVKAIQLLADKPWFKDMEFRMIGDGPLFDTILDPLRQYDNVFIERRFLKQAEIAALHKDYGIFLSPTRMDAQGVSRDEAMASGLVPVTNGVTAIPEFVDAQCGILAPGEDASAMADGIAALYNNADLFASMSEQAALRVARQSAKTTIVDAEIEVMT